MEIYVLYHHAAANVYDEEEIWRVVEKRPPQLMHYGHTSRQGRLSDKEEIPIVMNRTEVLLQRALKSGVLVTRQSHSRYLNSQKEREMKRAANRTPKH